MDPEPSLSSWQDHLQDESLMPANDDDFTKFLEFGMPFPSDLGASQAERQQRQQQQQQQSLPPRSVPSSTAPDQLVRMDTDDPTAASFHLHTGNAGSHDVSSQQGPPSSGLPMASYSATTAVMSTGFYDQAQQPPQFQDHQHLPQQQQQQPQEPLQQPSSHYHIPNGQTIIPPTPNSIELHGNAARYPQRVDEYEQVRTGLLHELWEHRLTHRHHAGVLHSSHFPCNDTFGNSIPPPGIHHSWRVFHTSHLASSRSSECQFQQWLSFPARRTTNIRHGLSAVSR